MSFENSGVAVLREIRFNCVWKHQAYMCFENKSGLFVLGKKRFNCASK